MDNWRDWYNIRDICRTQVPPAARSCLERPAGIVDSSGAGYSKRHGPTFFMTFFQLSVFDDHAFDAAAKEVDIELAKLKELLEREP